MRLAAVVVASVWLSGCASLPAALRGGDVAPSRFAANDMPGIEQPAVAAAEAKPCERNVDDAFKRGWRLVRAGFKGAASGAVIGIASVAKTGGCADPATCGSLIAGTAAIGAVFGAAFGVKAAHRENTLNRLAGGDYSQATCIQR